MSFSEGRPLENQPSRKVALPESRGPGKPPVKSPTWKVALLESRRPGIRHPMTSPLGKSPSRKARPPGKSPSRKVAPPQSQHLGKLSPQKVASESHPPEKPRPRKAALSKTRLPGKAPLDPARLFARGGSLPNSSAARFASNSKRYEIAHQADRGGENKQTAGYQTQVRVGGWAGFFFRTFLLSLSLSLEP